MASITEKEPSESKIPVEGTHLEQAGSSSEHGADTKIKGMKDSDVAAMARRIHGDPALRLKIENRLRLKLDLRLMPTVIIIFIMNYIDRTNVTTARLSGLQSDLNLTDIQYESTISLLYSTYIIFQVPSNLLLNYISKPSLYIPTMVCIWGLISLLTGISQSFTGIALIRVAIGIPEAAFYPGTIYLLSRWYTKKELAFRSALLYAGLIISNAFGSLMAAGILGNMEGKLGIRGWRWLFFIEGAITITIGFIAMVTLPDFPENTRWMTSEEKLVAQQRLSEDAGEADKDTEGDSAWRGIYLALSDPKVPVFMVMTFVQLLGLSFVNFFPTLTATLGYSTTVTLLLCAPPWAYAMIINLTNARHADATGERFGHLVWTWVGVIIGYIIAMSTQATAARYIALFLMAAGYAGFALTLVWVSNSFPRPPVKRAAAIGFVNGFGNLGNLVGSYVWSTTWGPTYRNSMGIAITGLSIAIILSFVIRQMLVKQNKNLDRLDQVLSLTETDRSNAERIRATAELEGITLDEAVQMKQGFRYLV